MVGVCLEFAYADGDGVSLRNVDSFILMFETTDIRRPFHAFLLVYLQVLHIRNLN